MADDELGRLVDPGSIEAREPAAEAEAGSAASPATRSERAAAYLRTSWPWIVAVAIIIAVSAILRFWELGKQSMWFDELFSANATAYGPQIAIKITASDTNPPLYYIVQSFFSMAFGREEWAMRLLPALVGVLATGVMYLAGRRLFDRPTGAVAAGLFAVSTIAIQYAQEARMYSMLMLFAALVLWLFALLVEKPTITRAVLLGIVLAAMAYTHVYGYMAAPMLLIPVLLLPRLRKRIGPHIAVTYVVTGLLFLPWLFVIPSQIGLVQTQVAGGQWWMKAPVDIGGKIVASFSAFSPGQDALSAAIFMALLLVGFAVRTSTSNGLADTSWQGSSAEMPWQDSFRAMFRSFSRRGEVGRPAEIGSGTSLADSGVVSESDILWVLLTLSLLPIFVGLLLSKYVTPIATTRNALVSLPAAYILAVRGGFKLWKPVGILAFAGLLVLGVSQLPSFYAQTDKGAWRQAAEMVTDQPQTGVLTEDWESAFNMAAYSSVLGVNGSLHCIWVNQPNAKPSPQGRAFDDNTEVGVPAFVWRWQRVYVISQHGNSSVAQYMDALPGWTYTKTQDFGTPVVREYTRLHAPVPTP